MDASNFKLIREEFVGELDAIRQLVETFWGPGGNPKVRIAAANSATLLVAATFEEFVREMARAYARMVVTTIPSFDKLPKKLVSTVWKRSMEGLARLSFDVEQFARESLTIETRFSAAYSFVKGDLMQEIYQDLIHNENNMRPSELNSMFKVAGLSDMCAKVCQELALREFFGETEAGKAHGKLLAALDDFFERRNNIAHALNPGQSSGPEQIIADLDMLNAFSLAMLQTLDNPTPRPTMTPNSAPATGPVSTT